MSYVKHEGMKFPVLWLSFVSECIGRYREGDMPHMGLSVHFTYHLALWCKSCKNKNKLKICCCSPCAHSITFVDYDLVF